MKSLKEILERELIGTLPFSFKQFEDFIANLAGPWDEKLPSWTDIENSITTTYGEKAWRTFQGWCEGTFYNTEPEKMYAFLQKLPKDRLERFLGAGSDGAAIGYKDKVIKWFHKNRTRYNNEWELNNDKKFFLWCKSHKSSYFPIVYRVADKYVVMERVEAGTKKCFEYCKVLDTMWYDEAGDKTPVYKLAAQGCLPADVDIKPEWLEAYNWYAGLIDEADEAGFEPADCRPNNLGERKDGSIVWFDI